MRVKDTQEEDCRIFPTQMLKNQINGKFLAVKNCNMAQNNQSIYLKNLEKEQQIEPKLSRRKEIINLKAEINDIKNSIFKENQRSRKLALKRLKLLTFVKTGKKRG